jgi:hypothetical protein
VNQVSGGSRHEVACPLRKSSRRAATLSSIE